MSADTITTDGMRRGAGR